MLYIYLKSYDINLLNNFCNSSFFNYIKGRYGVVGPIFLPKKQKIYKLTRSPHVNNRSKEGFEMIVYKQIFVINLYTIFKREFPLYLRKVHYAFYEWVPQLLLKGQPNLLGFQKLLKRKIPAGISLKFSFK